ncbi:tuftelin-interacting protein 11-like [Liolophura sinensis]|uniref:tuftelin-interacting protein 11-like n=1 Tax=Liolophura sinensis TaxID=3198878 RepID=UPI0031591661
MSSPEVDQFEISERDLEDALNPGSYRPRISKNKATYGIWAESDDEEDTRPSLGRKKKANYTAPIGFISGGLKQGSKVVKPGQEDEEDSDEDFDTGNLAASIARERFKSKSQKRPGTGFHKHSDKAFGGWEKHTKGIGQKLLQKMGYEPGKGLGKKSQGITAPIEAVQRKGTRATLQYYGQEKPASAYKNVVDSDEEEAKEFKEQLQQWKKQPEGLRKRPKYQYKTAQELIETGSTKKRRGPASDIAKVKVIDMTGREKKVLSGYHAISHRHDRPDEDEDDFQDEGPKARVFDMPELIHNLNLLVDMAEEEIVLNDRKLRHEKDMIINMNHERERLDAICREEEKQIERLNKVLDMVASCEERTKPDCPNPLSLAECVEIFQTLQTSYYEEYKMYDLSALAAALVFPMMRQYFKNWDPLREPRYGVEAVKEWRYLLEGSTSQYSQDIKNLSPYQQLLWEVWLPLIRPVIMKWQVRDCEPVIALVDAWMPVLPQWIVENVQDQLIMPRLLQEVDCWNPLTDMVPIHAWLHPWLPIMGDKLEPLYAPIRHKLANALINWHPSDVSAKLILQPWLKVFKPGHMEAFVVKNILPKLAMCMQEFMINPHQQVLEPWRWLMEWSDIIPTPSMVSMLEKAFFPKWLQVLCTWLGNMPNYEEVTKWYLGWKTQFPDNYLSHPTVREQFSRALDIMNRAVSGHFQPGAKENMAYFTHTERRQMEAKPAPAGATEKREAEIATKAAQNISAAGPTVPYSFRDLVEKKAEENDLLCVPIVGKMHQGKQVYKFGSQQIYIDRSVLFMMRPTQHWVPVSLQALLDCAR